MRSLTDGLIEARSIKNYDFQFSRSKIRPKLMYLFKVSFLITLDIYKAYFKSHMDTETRSFIFFVRNYCICTPQGFITKCFLIFIVDELKNFVVNNIHSSCQSQSHTRICVRGLVTNWRFVHQGKEGYYKFKFNWVLKQRFNCRLVFLDKPGQW